MKDKSIIVILVVVLLGTIALATGFKRTPNSENPWLKRWDIHFTSEQDDQHSRESSISAEGAQSAHVTIEQEVGEMVLAGGAVALMDARFDCSRDSAVPDVAYDVTDGKGELSVVQRAANDTFGDARNAWKVSMNSTMPLDFDVKCGVGEGTLNFSSINLGTLDALCGVGATTIDLTGDRTSDVEANLVTGIGETTVLVSDKANVRITAERGIGELNLPESFTSQDGVWVRGAFADGEPVVNISVKQGVGEFTVQLAE